MTISSYSVIRNGVAKVNNDICYQDSNTFNEFIKGLYRNQEIKYPKFFKMDRLSKLALTAAELTLKGRAISDEYKSDDIGIFLANSASSLDTDREHQKSIQDRNDYFPSPAVFVYTLPNICIGEIAIKHKVKGSNNFFIFDNFDAQFFANYIHDQFTLNKVNCALFGWVELDNENYESVIFLAEKNKKSGLPLNSASLKDIYYN